MTFKLPGNPDNKIMISGESGREPGSSGREGAPGIDVVMHSDPDRQNFEKAAEGSNRERASTI